MDVIDFNGVLDAENVVVADIVAGLWTGGDTFGRLLTRLNDCASRLLLDI